MAELETDDVRNALDHLSTVEFETSNNANGIRVAVAEEDIGKFWKAIRNSDMVSATTSKRIGGTLVAHIEAEKSGGLGDLFK